MSQTPQTDAFTALNKHQYANLFTYRKNGEAIKTPIWFSLKNGKLYVVTTKNAGKVKRIRNNGRVMIGPSDARGNPLGETMEAKARVLGPDEVEIAKAALDEKYGLFKAVFDFFMTVRGVERDWVEIEPA